MNHEVLNQPPPLVDYNPFAIDRALRHAVAREGAGWACAELEDFGRICGSAEVIEWGALANTNILRFFTPTIATVIAAMKSSSIPPGTI